MKKIVEQIIKILIYGTFFVPLVVVPSSFIFPFIVPKILLLRTLVTLMVGGYAVLLIINWKEYRPRITPLSLALLAFLMSFVISTFVGVDPYHSFWDNHERMLGLFTILHYVAYYFVATAIFRSWTDWKWALRIFLLAGSIVMFIGLLQVVNPQLLLNQGGDRVASTLGNSIYVGGYGMFLFFVALLLFLKEKNVVWKNISVLLGLLALAGLFYSGTRGSLLGLVGGILFALLAYVFLNKNNPRLRRNVGIGLLALVLITGVLYINRKSEWVSTLPTVGRFFSGSLLGGTAETRFIAWQVAFESWKERPIFGWGPNNFFYAFNQYYNPRSLEFGYSETWFDNAHNILLNTLAVQGLIGLLAYLAIFVVAAAQIWRAGRSGQVDKHVMIIGIAFLVAHLMQNVTVFEDPTSYLYFMFWLALVNRTVSSVYSRVTEQNSLVDRVQNIFGSSDQTVSPVVLGALLVACLAIIFVFEIQPARANTKTLDAMTQLASDPLTGLAAVKDTLNFSSPHIDDIRSDLAREVLNVVNSASSRLGKDTSNEMLTTVTEALQENVLLHPRDIRLYMMLAQVEQLQAVVNNDGRYLLDAERYLTGAITYSPERQQLLYMLATIEAQLNKKDEAVKIMEQAMAEDPKIGESYWRLAYIYNFYKDAAKAKETLDQAKQQGVSFDAQGQQVEAMIDANAGAAGGTKK